MTRGCECRPCFIDGSACKQYRTAVVQFSFHILCCRTSSAGAACLTKGHSGACKLQTKTTGGTAHATCCALQASTRPAARVAKIPRADLSLSMDMAGHAPLRVAHQHNMQCKSRLMLLPTRGAPSLPAALRPNLAGSTLRKWVGLWGVVAAT